jgi:hypothetical protein
MRPAGELKALVGAAQLLYERQRRQQFEIRMAKGAAPAPLEGSQVEACLTCGAHRVLHGQWAGGLEACRWPEALAAGG